MASLSGEAMETVASQRELSLPSAAGDSIDTGGAVQKVGETDSVSSSRDGRNSNNSASVGLSSSSVPPGIGRNNVVSDERDRTRDRKDSRDRGSRPLTGAKNKEQALWYRLESIMTAKQSHVQQVLEEFGIAADVPPTSDPLEEQVWRVVEGELSLQEAADLV